MEKKVLKKLQLNKETVSLLNGEKMSKVLGGGGGSDGYTCNPTDALCSFCACHGSTMISEINCPVQSAECESAQCDYTYYCVTVFRC